MTEGLFLLNDVIFKVVFGSEKSTPVLRPLLNSLLGLSGDERIATLDILNPNLDKEHVLDKGVILDVRARDHRGRLYNIEVQVAAQPAYTQRTVYYLARLFAGQLEPGEPYSRIARTIGISLCDFVLFPDLEELHSTYRLFDRAHHRELTDILELHFIELAKFRREKPHELRTPFEKWLHVLKFGGLYEAGPTEVPDILEDEEGIAMALESMRNARASDEVRQLIEARLKAGHDRATQLEAARDEGREEGREEGRAEVARQMRDQGFDEEAIYRATGLRLPAP